MRYFWASHNLMPKIIMEWTGLDITRPYHSLYSSDCRNFNFLGMITDLVVTLDQLPTKSILMDVVVENVPATYIIIFSRS